MTRKVDPIHFFNERGMSVLSEAHMAERIKELEARNEQLQRLNTALLRRLKATGQLDEDEAKPSYS